MSELYSRILNLCEGRSISVGKMCNELGISRGNLTELKMERIKTLKSDNLTKIASYFGVSVDYLLGNEKKPAPVDRDGLTAKDRRDIARELERMMASIEDATDGSVMFDGNPLTDGARETLRNAIAMGLEYAKKVNKETYTPKKYKKTEE